MVSHNRTQKQNDEAEIQRLLFRVSNLAAAWRGAYGNPEHQKAIVVEYHKAIAQLDALGWQDALDWDSELPNELMPKNHQYASQPTNWKMPPPQRTCWQRLWDHISSFTKS